MTGRAFNGWHVAEYIDSGGNGSVYVASRDGLKAAIKFVAPEHFGMQRGERFRHEIEGMSLCRDVEGVLPVLKHHVPDTWTDADPPWFVMPLATPAKVWQPGLSTLADAVELCLSLARTLAELHKRGIAHRDLKPGNILKYDGRWVLGDLGLVDFPGKAEVTESGESIGPTHYMAPEMLRAGGVTDARPADVYSLAKVLWTLGTKQNFPLPGWQAETAVSVRLSANVAQPRARLLDPLIDQATRIDPAERPKMAEFARELAAWLEFPPAQSISVASPTDSAAAAIQRAVALAAEQAESRRQIDALAAQWERGQKQRIAEVLRPLAEECKRGLESVFGDAFGGVSTGAHQRPQLVFTAGAEAMIPRGRLNVSISGILVLVHRLTKASLRFECTVTHPTLQSHGEFWRENFDFIVGGAEEEHVFRRVEAAVRDALVRAIDKARQVAEGFRQ